MKVAIITDTHFCFKRSNRVFEEFIIQFHERLVEYCLQNDIKTILHGGDFFDTRTNINMITLNTVKTRFMDVCRDHGIKLHINVGNHDCSYRNSVDSSSVAQLFREYENVVVYEKPTVIYFEDSSNLLMVPWIAKDEEEEFKAMIDDASLKTEICLGHFEFKGFLYQKGVMADVGMESTTFTPKFDLILSGHYHSKSSNGNVHYLGTAYDLTWADYDDTKYFHVLDTVTKELTPIEQPVRMFHKVFYNEDLVSEEDIKELDDVFRDKVVKVVVTKRKNMVKFDNLMDKIYAQNPYDVSVVDESVIQAKKEIKVDPTILTKGTLEIINQMIDEQDLGTEYHVPKLKQLMHDFYMEAE